MSDGPVRLGLALSGGGFRASFFHLGVLRRLAELDLLRHVSAISTVSGGSIVGAHYYLLLKEAYQANGGKLTQQQFVGLVQRLEQEFATGNSRDLRNRLLMHPLTHLKSIVFGQGYGNRMAKLYTKAFYATATRTLYPNQPAYAKNGIPLRRGTIDIADKSLLRGGFDTALPNSGASAVNIAEINEIAGDDKVTGVRIPKLIINATSLNSGGSFQFMISEDGGRKTGYVRFDEVFLLLQYKLMIQRADPATPLRPEGYRELIDFVIAEADDIPKTWDGVKAKALRDASRFPPIDHFNWWLAARAVSRSTRNAEAINDNWRNECRWLDWQIADPTPLQHCLLNPTSKLYRLATADFMLLRSAKIAAWFLLDDNGWSDAKKLAERCGRKAETRNSYSRADYERRFWEALRRIDADCLAELEAANGEMQPNGGIHDDILRFVMNVYYFNSADAIDWRAGEVLSKLTLSDAVAASANFPPVFTPFKLAGLFDTRRIAALSLTDGGVHDNQGLDTLVDDGCTHIIGSDAGGLLTLEDQPSDSRVPMMARIIDILLGGLRDAQLGIVADRCAAIDVVGDAHTALTGCSAGSPAMAILDRYCTARPLRGVCFFHMTSTPSIGSPQGLSSYEPQSVASIRTDLDGFNELERRALIFQGYQLADRYLRGFLTKFSSAFGIAPPPVPTNWPAQPWNLCKGNLGHQRKTLQQSSRLAFRATGAQPVAAAAVCAIVAIAAMALKIGTWENIRTAWEYTLPRPSVQMAGIVPQRWIEFYAALTQSFARNVSIVGAVAALALFFVLTMSIQKRHGGAQKLKGNLFWSAVRAVKADLLRPVNWISGFGLTTFLITGKIKWLLFFLPLWALPLAALFVLYHWVAWPVWRAAGD